MDVRYVKIEAPLLQNMDRGVKLQLEQMKEAVHSGKRYIGIEPIRWYTDADSMAVMLASAMRAAGYTCRFQVVRQKGQREFNHVYVEVWHPEAGIWVPLDPQQVRPLSEWAETVIQDI